ncbi:MAG: autotransporter-associated beta strand repeat-containing protein, partial [Tepidisphaeraceae bacterium]
MPLSPAVTQTLTFTNANPALNVGLQTSYLGFTGGTGGANALQQISNFTYTGSYNTANLSVQNGAQLTVAGFTNHSLVSIGTGTLTTVDPTVVSSTDSLVTLPNGVATLNIASGGQVQAGNLSVNSGSTLNLPSTTGQLVITSNTVNVTDATINHAAAMTFPILNLSGALSKGGIVQPDGSVLSGDLNITTLNPLTSTIGINANAGNVNLAPPITIGSGQILNLGGLSADGKSAGMINFASTPVIGVGGTLSVGGKVGITVPTTTLTNNGNLIASANSTATLTGPGSANLRIIGSTFTAQGITAPGLNMSWTNSNNDVNGMDTNGGLLTQVPTGSAVFNGPLAVDGFTGGPNGQNGGFALLTGKPLGDPAGINATNYGFVWKGVFVPTVSGYYQFGGGDTNGGGPGFTRVDDNEAVFVDLNHNGSIDAATEKVGGTGCCGGFAGSSSSNVQGVASVNRVMLMAGVAYPITVGFGQGGGDAGMSLAIRNVSTSGAWQLVNTTTATLGQWGLAATGPANYSQITDASGAALAVDSFTGHYAVNLAGTLNVTSATNASDAVNLVAGGTTAAPATLTTAAGVVTVNNLFVGDGNALLVNGTGALTVTNSVSIGDSLGTALLNYNGSAGLTLPANTTLNNGSVLNSGPGSVVLTGGTVLGTGRLGAVAGQSVQVNGPIGGSGGLAVLWQTGGVVQLNAINTYTGTTTIGSQGGPGFVSTATSTATLRIGVDNAFSVASRLNFNAAPVAGMFGTVDLNGHPIGVRGFSSGDASAVINNTSATPVTLTVTGDIIDNPAFAGVLENTGGGALTLIMNNTSSTQNASGETHYGEALTGTANTYTGGTLLNSGILQISGDGSLGSVAGVLPTSLTGGVPNINLMFNGGQLFNNGGAVPLSASRNILIGPGGAFVRDGWNQPITINGTMSGPGGFNVVWDGGPLTLGAVNTYVGDTTIGVNGNGYNPGAAAALVLGTNNAIPSGAGKGNLIFGTTNATSLNLNGYNQTVNGLSGGGTASIYNGAGATTSTLTIGANNANGYTFGGVIADSGTGKVALTKIGTGTQILNGTSTYSGPTDIEGGTIRLSTQNLANFSNTAAWTQNGSGNWNGSVLNLTTGATGQATSAFLNTKVPVNSAFTATFTYTDVGGGGADGAAFVLQNSGLTALGGGGGALGYGGITPSAAVELNIYAGNAGYTRYGTNGATGGYAATGAVNVASGDPIKVQVGYDGSNILTETLTDLTTSATYTTSYTVGSLASQVGANTAYIGFTGASGGVASTTNISNFSASTIGQLPATTAVIMASNTTLDLNGINQQIGSLADKAGGATGQQVLLGSGTLTVGNATSTTFSGAISGTGGVIKVGTGTLTLAGASTYFGGTTLDAGVVSIASDTALGDPSSPVNFAGGTLRVTTPNFASARTMTVATAGGSFDSGANSATLSGNISGAGTLAKIGTGTLSLTDPGVVSAGINVTHGQLLVSATSMSGPIILSSDTPSTNVTFNYAQGATGTYSGGISGTGTLTKTGAGTLVLNRANSFTGPTDIEAGTVQLQATAYRYYRFAVNSVYTAGSGLQYSEIAFYSSGTNSTNGARVMQTNITGDGGSYGDQGIPGLADNNLNTKSFMAAPPFPRYVTLDFGTPQAFTGYDWATANDSANNRNPNNWVVLGSNDNSTWTTLDTQTNAGATPSTTFTWAAGWGLNLTGGLSATSGVIMASNTTLDLNGYSTQISSLADNAAGATGHRVLLGTGTLTVGDTTSTSFSGAITGAGGLTKVGTGALTLSGANNIAGATTVNAGTLNLNAGSYGTLNAAAGTTNLNAPAIVTTANITGGTVNAGAGSIVSGTLTATSGTLRVADSPTAVATVGTADLSTGTPTVNTQSGSLAITNQLKLPGVNAVYTPGGSATSFAVNSVAGSNIANNAAARTLTLSGGTVALNYPPPPVTGVNIGGSTIGSYTYNYTGSNYAGGTWTVNGAGGDMWGGTEQSYFVFRAQNNVPFDVFTYANMTNVTNTWAKAGIMATGGTAAAPAAPFVFAAVTGSQGATFQRSDTTQNIQAGNSVQDWLRLTYDGNGNFTGYYSTQPPTTALGSLTWTSFGTYTGATMPSTFELGLMGCSHVDVNTLVTAQFTNAFLSNSLAPFVNFPNTNIAATASSTLDFGNAGSNNTLGALHLTAGTSATALTLQNASSLTLNGDAAGNAISATGSAGQTASIVAGTNAPSLVIATGMNVSVDPGVTLTVGPVINGASTLQKIGNGTLRLTNANTYTGATALAAGTLVVANGTNGSATGTGNVILNGGTLASDSVVGGTISGTVVAGTGPHSISPGGDGSIGSLTVGGLTVSSNTFLRFDITSPTVLDQITTGTLAGTGATVAVPAGLAPGDYKLVGFTTDTATNLSLALIGGGAVPAGYSLSTTQDAGFVDLIVGNLTPTYLWKGGAGASGHDWGTAANWNNSIPGAGNVAILSDPSATQAVVDLGTVDRTVAGVTFTTAVAGGNTIAAITDPTRKLILDGGLGGTAVVTVTGSGHGITSGVSLATNTTVSVDPSSDLGISGNIDGVGSLTKNGAGMLTLAGDNHALTGGIIINAGTLVATSLGTSLNALGGSNATVTVNNFYPSAKLQIETPGVALGTLINNNLTNVNGGASTINTIQGTGNLTVAAPAALTSKSIAQTSLTVNGSLTL